MEVGTKLYLKGETQPDYIISRIDEDEKRIIASVKEPTSEILKLGLAQMYELFNIVKDDSPPLGD